MHSAGRIGAATVVSGTDGQQVPDKYQSYMRATMRSVAKTQGRDTLIAEAMVDTGSVNIGIIKKGKTLTLTTSEAIANGFCEGTANSIEEVIQKLGITDYELIKHQESALDKVISILMNPVLSGILMLVIIGGIYFELQTPGVGFPLVAAIIAAVLYFAPLYLDGLAENWEILIFLGGIGLLAVEIFVLPGFGVAGIAGIVLMVLGLTLSLIRNVKLDFTFAGGDEIAAAIFRVVITLLAAIVLFLLFADKLLFKGPFKKLVLADTQNRHEGYVSQTDSSNSLIGKTGITINDLRPAGTVEIDNERYDVISDGEHIPKNTNVKVVKVQGNYYVVAKA
jgi:membrane-bound serine protease (ClpP class)